VERLTAAGFVPVAPPVLVRREAMFGTGFLPTDEQQIVRQGGDGVVRAPRGVATEHELLLAREEEILQALELPYRVVDIAAGDLGGSEVRLRGRIPSQGTYRELTSTSNCTDYQARRIGCRVREPDGNRPLHTLNGTAVAIGRTIVALLENHQQPDGSVRVPAALQAHLGADLIQPAK
jgi:seryl-tRNA synthetase